MKAITVMFAITGCLLAGTVAAATEAEATEETLKMLDVYERFAEDYIDRKSVV